MRTIIFFLFALALPASGQEVRGTVLGEGGRPVPFALVQAENGDPKAVADADGVYVIRGLPNGRVVLKVSAVGFADRVVETTVMASETVVLDVQMNRTRGIRTMENLPSMDDRPAALRNPEGIAGCYWISAIGSGAEVWRFDGEGMVFVPGVEVPRYTWDSPPDSTYLRVEMGDPLNGPGHLTITLGPAPNWRLLPTVRLVSSHMSVSQLQVRSIAVRVACDARDS